jgi:hypothetical protein
MLGDKVGIDVIDGKWKAPSVLFLPQISWSIVVIWHLVFGLWYVVEFY